MKNRSIYFQEIKDLVEQGLSYADISKEVPLSRQRIHQIVSEQMQGGVDKNKREAAIEERRKEKKSNAERKFKSICQTCSILIERKQRKKFCSRDCSDKAKEKYYHAPEGESNAETYRKRRAAYYAHNKKHRENIKRLNREQRARHPEKTKARAAVAEAIKKGILIRPYSCSICSLSEQFNSVARIEAHHPDYSKPLDVIWACTKCHKALHMSLDKLK